jgi:MFS family permease
MHTTAQDIAKPSNVLKNKNIYIIFSITLMAIMGVVIITPAFPSIGEHFHITPSRVSWLITVFTIPGVIFTPILGVLADRYGRKHVIVPSLILFGLAGAACFFADNFNTLLVLRFIQGIGSASLGSLNVTLIGDIFEGRQRSSALGYNAAAISVGTASFPIIGGFLAEISWQTPFLVALIAIPIALFVMYRLHTPVIRNNQTLGEYFSSTFKALKVKETIAVFALNLITFIILYGPFVTYLPFLISNKFHMHASVIGILLGSASIATIFSSSRMGQLHEKFGEIKLIRIGSFIYIAGLALFPLLPNVWLLLIPTVLFGIARGVNLPSLQMLLVQMAPMNQRAAIMSFNGMILRLGQTIGPMLFAASFMGYGINGVYITGIVIVVIMSIVSFTALKHKLEPAS